MQGGGWCEVLLKLCHGDSPSVRGFAPGLAGVGVDKLGELRKLLAERVRYPPIADLAQVLLVDGVNGELPSPVTVDRRRQQNRTGVIWPVDPEPGAIESGEIIKSNLRVGNEIFPNSRPAKRQ